ncbi:MAG TPA: hypothetical protein VF846_17335 [Thermoanaerobaculia bacterium]|jgi:hypothetical protein
MKSKFVRAGVAALTLVVCLSISPVAAAAPGDGSADLRERIIRAVKKLKNIRITILEDFPLPPKP